MIRIENLATKWLSIDIRNMCQESEIPKKDIRFSLLSEKEIILNNSTENEINNILVEKIELINLLNSCALLIYIRLNNYYYY